MIDLNFGFFWCGGKISYLRYLTFKSLRHFHPNSKISLYVSKKSNKDSHRWGVEQQDFEKEDKGKNYIDDIKQLDVNVIYMDYFGSPDYCPIFQVDMARWWMLYHGLCNFYLDMDQIILKPFDTLPLDKEFIFSQFPNADRAKYSPTGVIGGVKNGVVSKIMMDAVPKAYSSQNYNSSGPFIFERVIESTRLTERLEYFNAPYDYFYPINCSKDVTQIYSGEFIIPKSSYALHLYMGHPVSQKFNDGYDGDMAKNSNDTVSKFLRENGLV
jgi:hypothetical protein